MSIWMIGSMQISLRLCQIQHRVAFMQCTVQASLAQSHFFKLLILERSCMQLTVQIFVNRFDTMRHIYMKVLIWQGMSFQLDIFVWQQFVVLSKITTGTAYSIFTFLFSNTGYSENEYQMFLCREMTNITITLINPFS